MALVVSLIRTAEPGTCHPHVSTLSVSHEQGRKRGFIIAKLLCGRNW